MKLIMKSSEIKVEGDKEKLILEYFGKVNSDDDKVSIAHMKSKAGWTEPGQRPEFDEYTLVLKGVLRIETEEGEYLLGSGNGVLISAGEWVRYSTPDEDTEYISVCIPAFSPDTVHRDT